MTFRYRAAFYRAQTSAGNRAQIRLDSTKRRYDILKAGNEYIKSIDHTVYFCYTHINCRMKIKSAHNLEDFFFETLQVLKDLVHMNSSTWMNPKISSSVRKRAKLTKLFYKNPSDSLKVLLMSKSIECSNLIVTAKENYHKKVAEKLDNPFTAPKTYWSILNKFLGKRKTPNIPPLRVNDVVVSDFTTKANLFNNFSAHNVLLW